VRARAPDKWQNFEWQPSQMGVRARAPNTWQKQRMATITNARARTTDGKTM